MIFRVGAFVLSPLGVFIACSIILQRRDGSICQSRAKATFPIWVQPTEKSKVRAAGQGCRVLRFRKNQ